MSRFGTVGTPLTAISNSFELRWSSRSVVFHYNVVITPEWENRSGKPVNLKAEKGVEIMMRLQTQIAPQDFPRPGAFDGKKNLFSFQQYGFPAKEYSHIPIDPNAGRRMKTVRVKIEFIRSVNVGLLQALVQGQMNIRQMIEDGASDALNMLNFFVQAEPRRGHLHKGRSFFVDPGASRSDYKMSPLKLFTGYFQSVRPGIQRIVLNVDVGVGAVLPQQTLEQTCASVLGLQDRRGLLDLRDRELQKLRQFLKGVKVTVQTGNRRREKSIRDFIPDVGKEEFDKDGRTCTVSEHYARTHRMTIPPRMPGVRLGNHELIPIHICTVVTQLYKGRLQPEHIKEVLNFVPKNPQFRLQQIQAGWQRLGHNTSEFLQSAGISISSQPLQVPGRLLPPPEIRYGRDSVSLNNRPGVWDVMRRQFLEPKQINSMITINFTGGRTLKTLEDFIRDLKIVMEERGMRVNQDAGIKEHNPQGSVKETLDTYAGIIQADLIIVILPESAEDLYVAVKRYGDVTRGVITQCVKWAPKIYHGYSARDCNQYHNNLTLKINGKLGGINHTPNSPITASVSSIPTMVVGIDVSHPAPGSKMPSIASLVASLDKHASRYFATTRVQHSRLERIEEIGRMLLDALLAFKDNDNPPPQRIIIFRDGVSEGEFETVRQQELGVIKNCLDAFYRETLKLPGRPLITFIIVGKRHHFRFFPNNNQAADRSGNMPAGFVVDREIGHPVYHDFYLQSQPGLKGTSVPSHYTTLEDEIFQYRSNDLQALAYALCHNYARSTRSVKVPAPVYYADLCARRAKFHYDQDVNFSDNMSVASGDEYHLDWYKQRYRPVSERVVRKQWMYFL